MEKIKINGKEFNLNVNRAKELGVLTSVFVNPKIGELFIQTEGMYKNCVYVLAHIGSHNVALVNTGLCEGKPNQFNCAGGGIWSGLVKVTDLLRITENEWSNISVNCRNTFKLVKAMVKLQ
jgi:hypothetical protein